MQLRSGYIIAPKVSVRPPKKSSTRAPKVAVVSTMRLRSGQVVGHTCSMTGSLPFNMPSSGVVSVEDKTTALAYVIELLMKNIKATRYRSKEENAITKTQYLESMVYVITQNMDFMLNVSTWSYFMKITVQKMIQFASDMQYYLNAPGYRFSNSHRSYLKEMMRSLIRLSFTVEMKLATKK